VVLQERAIRQVDAPYGLVGARLFERLYANPHPLHGGVIGVPTDLAGVTADDVRAFVSELLVPANATLVIAGRFDPATARALVADGLGRLPAGRRAPAPSLPPMLPEPVQDAREERLSREPRVTLAWRLPWVPHEDASTLELGAQLLTFLTDGAWGMRIDAGLVAYESESLFLVDLVVPYDEPASVVARDADGFVRFLTQREIPAELMISANLALDRAAMFELDDVAGRARLLTEVEQTVGARQTLAQWIGGRWDVDRYAVKETARSYLKGPRLVLHARPARPKAARTERE
jgi:zinc protease